VAIVKMLCNDRQVVVAEAVAVFPLIAILEAADDDDIEDGTFTSGISPDGSFEAPMADGVNGPVISGRRWDGVPLSL
jgi:hypothetical protein